MKKRTFVTLILIFFVIVFFDFHRQTNYQTLDITDDCKIALDINHNTVIDDNEYFDVVFVRPFCGEKNILQNEKVVGKLSDNAKIYIEKLTKNYYKKLFLNSRVRIDKGLITVNGKNSADLLIQEGFAINTSNTSNSSNVLQIQKLVEIGNKKEYFILNTLNLKYHKLNCPKVKSAFKTTYVLKHELPQKAQPCKYCLVQHNVNSQQTNFINSKIIEFKLDAGGIKIYETIGVGALKPSSKCSTEMCLALKKEIQNSKKTIKMAVYDFRKQPELLNALVEAQKRGVTIWVATDNKKDKNYELMYQNLRKFSAHITDDSVSFNDSKKLMHNKFVIFDGQKVWTGSTNFTDTGLSGFNANVSVLINSKTIAQIYDHEFENFWTGKYHSHKMTTQKNETHLFDAKVQVYFSPQDKIINDKIIPELRKATKIIYIPVFIFTHKHLADELIKAHKRGVDVRVIIDATSARNKYSQHSRLRKEGIPVKTENFAGKMHMKSVIIDDKSVFTGSMNLTKSGDIYNDENCLYIQNPAISKHYKDTFLLIWNKIPDKYLKYDLGAESLESIGSCFDGIDNDFDGLIDKADYGCLIK